MKKFMTTMVVIFAAQLTFAASINIAAAKALPDGTTAEIGPITLSTVQDIAGSGYACAAQDSTGGMLLYGYTAQNLITSNNFIAGDVITISAKTKLYYGTFEVEDIVLVEYEKNDPVTPKSIDIDDLQTGAAKAAEYLSMLVEIEDVTFSETGVFDSGNYTINADGETAVVRIQDNNDPLVGTTIPDVNCTIIGIMGVYSGTPQIFPLQIIPDVPLDDPSIVTPVGLEFGVVYPSHPRTFNIKIDNGGVSNDLIVTALQAEGTAFTSISNDFPYTVSPGAYLLLPVQYLGVDFDDVDQETFTIVSNDPSEPNKTVQLSGQVADSMPIDVWINEFDYDTPGGWSTEGNEFVEICGTAGTSLSGWSITFWEGYEGVISNYGTHVIGDFILNDEDAEFGFYVLGSADTDPTEIPIDEITHFGMFPNRSPVAVELLDETGTTVHFVEFGAYSADSFEDSWPDDITSFYDTGNSNSSVFLSGMGVERLSFSWDDTRYSYTPGTANLNQTLPEPTLAIVVMLAAALGLRKLKK